MNNSPNLLLASVSDAVYAALKPHLKTVELQHGAVIGETGGASKMCISRIRESSRWSSK